VLEPCSSDTNSKLPPPEQSRFSTGRLVCPLVNQAIWFVVVVRRLRRVEDRSPEPDQRRRRVPCRTRCRLGRLVLSVAVRRLASQDGAQAVTVGVDHARMRGWGRKNPVAAAPMHASSGRLPARGDYSFDVKWTVPRDRLDGDCSASAAGSGDRGKASDSVYLLGECGLMAGRGANRRHRGRKRLRFRVARRQRRAAAIPRVL
jgi:hypothetical protein